MSFYDLLFSCSVSGVGCVGNILICFRNRRFLKSIAQRRCLSEFFQWFEQRHLLPIAWHDGKNLNFASNMQPNLQPERLSTKRNETPAVISNDDKIRQKMFAIVTAYFRFVESQVKRPEVEVTTTKCDGDHGVKDKLENAPFAEQCFKRPEAICRQTFEAAKSQNVTMASTECQTDQCDDISAPNPAIVETVEEKKQNDEAAKSQIHFVISIECQTDRCHDVSASHPAVVETAENKKFAKKEENFENQQAPERINQVVKQIRPNCSPVAEISRIPRSQTPIQSSLANRRINQTASSVSPPAVTSRSAASGNVSKCSVNQPPFIGKSQSTMTPIKSEPPVKRSLLGSRGPMAQPEQAYSHLKRHNCLHQDTTKTSVVLECKASPEKEQSFNRGDNERKKISNRNPTIKVARILTKKACQLANRWNKGGKSNPAKFLSITQLRRCSSEPHSTSEHLATDSARIATVRQLPCSPPPAAAAAAAAIVQHRPHMKRQDRVSKPPDTFKPAENGARLSNMNYISPIKSSRRNVAMLPETAGPCGSGDGLAFRLSQNPKFTDGREDYRASVMNDKNPSSQAVNQSFPLSSDNGQPPKKKVRIRLPRTSSVDDLFQNGQTVKRTPINSKSLSLRKPKSILKKSKVTSFDNKLLRTSSSPRSSTSTLSAFQLFNLPESVGDFRAFCFNDSLSSEVSVENSPSSSISNQAQENNNGLLQHQSENADL